MSGKQLIYDKMLYKVKLANLTFLPKLKNKTKISDTEYHLVRLWCHICDGQNLTCLALKRPLGYEGLTSFDFNFSSSIC